jgi:hypothetical protein
MGPIQFFIMAGLDLCIVNICTSHMPRHGADSIFFYVLDSICALSIYAQVICHTMGLIQYLFLQTGLDLYIVNICTSHMSYGADAIFFNVSGLCSVNICTSHMPCHGADSIFFNGPDSVCAL